MDLGIARVLAARSLRLADALLQDGHQVDNLAARLPVTWCSVPMGPVDPE
ncbi:MULTISPECIES: hypothetical protein [unclassified Streptomyces]|nr:MULTISPECIES: hypothetical protein [unclassified Streptomyces]